MEVDDGVRKKSLLAVTAAEAVPETKVMATPGLPIQ